MIPSIKPTQVSVHNPVFGPRNLGHYFGSMKDLVASQEQYHSIVVIDDVMAGFMSPRDRETIPNRSYFVVQDFLNAGFDTEHNEIILTSQVLPEIMDLIMFYSVGLEQDYLMHLYENSFMGGLKSYQRRGIGLGLRPSVLEAVYPALGMPAISLGLDVEMFQGGEEIMGYTYIMEEIARGLKGKISAQFHVPVYEPSQNGTVLGIDGRYMFQDNCIFLSESVESLSAKIDMIQDKAVLVDWFASWGEFDLAEAVQHEEDITLEKIKMKELMISKLAPFRDQPRSISSLQEVLKKGEAKLKSILHERIRELKEEFAIGYFED